MPDLTISENIKARRKKRRIAIAALATVMLAGGGAAFAYWTAGGAGTGVGTAGSNVAISVVQTSTASNLRPGGAAQTLTGNFTNPNDSPVYVTSVTASISGVTKATGAPAGTCDATDYVLTGPTMTVNTQVPAGTAQGAWTGATIAFNNKPAANQDACKGATVNFSYTSN
ncbi:hypothetical protein [Cryobacterium sp. CG_9.6]|uniref:hypothetical protein n=1 Tax=Cryobacterium sp. CG_9.6 TaxID=2760710 RepID=UPI00247651D4|nr:hypothetical protein [Cryobacterium sp. CG_9.6]MDH6238421.1 hypothetical protein [Cryobacterium sp. CG_9.6]